MSKIHRIINNALWFTLLGPLIGLIAAIPAMYIYMGYPYRLFPDLARDFSFILIISYIWGSLPALAAGVIIASLPTSYQKLPLAALAGAITSASLPITLLIFFGKEDFEILWLSIFCGAISAAVMSQAVRYLPIIRSPFNH